MIRVLIFGMTENPGGVESFLINYYRNINKKKIQFDFLCNSHEPVAYEDELISLGARTFHIEARSKNRKKYRKELEYVFKNHSFEWEVIWVNVCSLANIDYLKVAKKYGIRKRIIHSHNSQNMDNILRGFLHLYNKKCVAKYATDFWACSEDAARWFYNEKIMKRVIIIHNAIDVERMKYDEEKRKIIRKKICSDDTFVIGNIGRLHFQKNQEFAIDIFKEFHHKYSDSLLVFIGQGDDEEKLREKVNSYGLEDTVLFKGVQKDIQGWLSSFDFFLFPSRFEGLSVVALEAQANNLPILASEGVIPEEVKMSDNLEFFSLQNSSNDWCDKIIQMKDLKRMNYMTVKQMFVEKGYDIKTEIKRIERLLVK